MALAPPSGLSCSIGRPFLSSIAFKSWVPFLFLVETATESGNTGSHTDDHRKDHGTVLSTLAVLGVVVVVAAATGWVCRSRCPHGIRTRYQTRRQRAGLTISVVGLSWLPFSRCGRCVRPSPSLGWEWQLLNLEVGMEHISMEARLPSVLNSGQTQGQI